MVESVRKGKEKYLVRISKAKQFHDLSIGPRFRDTEPFGPPRFPNPSRVERLHHRRYSTPATPSRAQRKDRSNLCNREKRLRYSSKYARETRVNRGQSQRGPTETPRGRFYSSFFIPQSLSPRSRGRGEDEGPKKAQEE
ncbi:hypothetical protein KQX54_004697 [Cotesia glomerata]|uniref:Uncharacterized protein n=1 Tax=Cotesia glomerata TaxID=32391 RepID=A0AAV7IPP3_COTGL|nr:hypothetical protein KQX54_004697 [Cotesia glomerata]